MEKKILVEFLVDEEKLRYITDTKSLDEAVRSEFKDLESDGIRLNGWRDVSDEVEKGPEIVVHIDEDGMFQGVFVSPEIAETCPVVELIDFCTDDPEEEAATKQAYDDIISEVKAGRLIDIMGYCQRIAADDEEDAEEDNEDE